MGSKKKVKKMPNDKAHKVEKIPDSKVANEEVDGVSTQKVAVVTKKAAKAHKKELESLKETQPEFYEYLKDVDKELLEFDDEGFDDGNETGEDDDGEMDEDDDAEMSEDDAEGDGVYSDDDFPTEHGDDSGDDDEVDFDDDDDNERPFSEERVDVVQSKSVITMDMVNSWCKSINESGKIAPVRSLLKAFRVACHYADSDDNSSAKLTTMSNDVLNKIMVVTLCKMGSILRKLMNLPTYGGRKEMIVEVKNTRQWTKYNHLVKSYLANSLHALDRMTDAKEISFTLRRLKHSSIFMAAFPALLRKYIKVALHFWSTGGGALTAAAFLFLRDLCIRLGSDCLDECLKGLYKAYVMNCQYVSATKLQHISLLRHCFVLFLSVDLSMAYQHGFTYIRQLAMILREALSTKTKEAFRKVYEWKYISCLELWTGAICEYGMEPDFKPLAYPLTQIIYGATRLVPTARYFPLRMRCVRMLNRIAAATDTFIPVSMLLLDMLEMKELHSPVTGGVGKAADFSTILKVGKPTLKTRAFQEACVSSAIEELGEHLSHWSYSVAFYELSFIPAVRLRAFCKNTKVDRFRKETRELIRQIEANSKFTNDRRAKISFLPNDLAATSFLEDEKKSGASPLSKYAVTLRQKAQQRNDSLSESSVLYGTESAVFGKKSAESDEEHDSDEEDNVEDEGAAVFQSSWLENKASHLKEEKNKKNKKKPRDEEEEAVDEDIVKDLVLSSDDDDDDEPMDNSPPPRAVGKNKKRSRKKGSKKEGLKDASSKTVQGSKKESAEGASSGSGQGNKRKKRKRGTSHKQRESE